MDVEKGCQLGGEGMEKENLNNIKYEKILNEHQYANHMINRLQELEGPIAELKNILAPKLHVCTQSKGSVVPVNTFFVDGTKGNVCYIMASHDGRDHWNILGAYETIERAMQIYKEMLHCPENEVYIMPTK